MTALQNIIWVGTGNTSLPTLRRVAQSNRFNIHLLVRNAVTSYTSLPSTLASVTQVDYTSHPSLVKLFLEKSAEVVIVFTAFRPGAGLDVKHLSLINAAMEAGVKYFIPSEWALDTAGSSQSTVGKIGPTLPTNMVLAAKRVSHNYLLSRASEGKINFAAIYCGVVVESCLRNGMLAFNFSTKTATLDDRGIAPFPTTSTATLSKALTTLLVEPVKINNTFYHISDGVLTQQEILRVIEKESGNPWEKKILPIEAERLNAVANMAKGTFGVKEFRAFLKGPFFGGLQMWLETDNEVLGIADDDKVDVREEVGRVARVFLEKEKGNSKL